MTGHIARPVLYGLVHDRIQIGVHFGGIDARGTPRRLGNHPPEHEPPLWNRAELGRRHTISSDDDCSAGLHLAEDRAGVVAELALRNDPAHGE